MEATKFLDLYEQAINKAMEAPVKVIGECASHFADLHCIGRMRAALAMSATSTADGEGAA